MGNMVTFYREDYCMDCNASHSLVMVDTFGNKLNMANIMKDPSIISRRLMDHILCNNCNREYNIDWSADSRIPKPLLTNLELNQFLQGFKLNNKYILYK